MNAKQRELAELQALAQRRLKGARANFAEGAKAAKEVKRDLEWTQKKVKYVFAVLLQISSVVKKIRETDDSKHPQNKSRAQASRQVSQSARAVSITRTLKFHHKCTFDDFYGLFQHFV